MGLPGTSRAVEPGGSVAIGGLLPSAVKRKVVLQKRQGGKWRATSDELLDDYQQRLAAKGYLVVTHKQLEISHGSAEIVSILWPTEMKWHSWLALMWAGEPSQDIAPMVIVMNAADAPEADPMADAFIHLLQSIRLDHAPAGAPNLSGM